MAERTGSAAGIGGCDACDGCGAWGASRRDFLRAGALALALLGGSRLPLAAATRGTVLRFAAGRPRDDGTVTYEIPDADGATIDRGNQMILVRWEDRVYAFALSCPHQRTALRWEEDDRRFQCPKHHSKYQPDGTFISGRATRGMDRYPIRLEQGKIVVDTGSLYHNDEDSAGWDAAAVDLTAAPGDPGGRT